MKQFTQIFIIAGISIIMMLSSETLLVKNIRNSTRSIFKPITKNINSISNNSDSLVSVFFKIRELDKSNADLKKENTQLKAQLSQMEELRKRIESIEKQYNIQGLAGLKDVIPAAVISRSPSVVLDSISVDKGEADGVKLNQAVLSEGFLIGKIVKVFPNNAQIELVSSHRFIAPIILQDSRALGLLKGGIKGIIVEQLPVDMKIIKGEKVVTSGLAGEFQSGLPIGIIKDIVSKPSDIFQTANLEIPININKVELVIILK